MITIEYELYFNDFTRKSNLFKSFPSLEHLESWIFDHVKTKSDFDYHCFFPTHEEPSRIEAGTDNRYEIWIHQISNDCGIIFSDGKYTNSLKHWNDEAKAWCKHCEERRKKPTFNFI